MIETQAQTTGMACGVVLSLSAAAALAGEASGAACLAGVALAAFPAVALGVAAALLRVGRTLRGKAASGRATLVAAVLAAGQGGYLFFHHFEPAASVSAWALAGAVASAWFVTNAFSLLITLAIGRRAPTPA